MHAALLADRHARGSYYTPDDEAADLARQAIAARDFAAPRVIDPACGGGSFLLAAGEAIAAKLVAGDPGLEPLEARRLAANCLYGVDLDGEAVRIARLSLWLWLADRDVPPGRFDAQVIAADALLDDDRLASLDPPFDIVLANPPFASVFTRAADPSQDPAIRDRYQTARGAYDLAIPFVERSYTLLADGGVAGLILPDKVLAASYGAAMREFLARKATLLVIRHQLGDIFDAAVYPAAILFSKSPPPRSHAMTLKTGEMTTARPQEDLAALGGAPWSALFSPDWEALAACLKAMPRLADAADISAGLSVSEAYDLRDRVIESPMPSPPLNAFMALPSGLITRYGMLWGQRKAYILKRCFQRPVIPMAAVPERRRAQSHASKIILSGMALRPQAYLDPGLSQACVATVIITGANWPLAALCAYLNSGVIARIYRAMYGGLALSGGYLRFGKRELGGLPFPAAGPEDPRVMALADLYHAMIRVDDAGDAARLEESIDSLVVDLLGLDQPST